MAELGGNWQELGWPIGGRRRQEVGLDRWLRGQSTLSWEDPVRQKLDIEQAYIKMPESSI
jgi:hypothetical protein